MRYCKNCGLLAPHGADRCPQCGAPLPADRPTAPAPDAQAGPHYEPASEAPQVPAMDFAPTLGTLVLFMIPIVGFVMMLVWSFADATDTARRRLARAYLVRTLIVACLIALLLLVGAFSLAGLAHSMYYAW